jgi:hypothetical protein
MRFHSCRSDRALNVENDACLVHRCVIHTIDTHSSFVFSCRSAELQEQFAGKWMSLCTDVSFEGGLHFMAVKVCTNMHVHTNKHHHHHHHHHHLFLCVFPLNINNTCTYEFMCAHASRLTSMRLYTHKHTCAGFLQWHRPVFSRASFLCLDDRCCLPGLHSRKRRGAGGTRIQQDGCLRG